MGSDTLDDNMVLEAAKGTDIQLYVSTFYQEGGNPDFDAGIKNYINTASDALDANGGNDTIAAVTAMGYDAYYVALEAIKKADSVDPAAIKAALWDVTYDGVSGHIAFKATNGTPETGPPHHHSPHRGAWELRGQQEGPHPARGWIYGLWGSPRPRQLRSHPLCGRPPSEGGPPLFCSVQFSYG